MSQKTEFTFPVVELNEWRSRLVELDALAPANPFAVILIAQIQASAHADKAARLGPLLKIVRRLYDYGYDGNQIRQNTLPPTTTTTTPQHNNTTARDTPTGDRTGRNNPTPGTPPPAPTTHAPANPTTKSGP
ncbi:hypothetical protein [Castellaniella sp.]|uniref:hypothetical protein n=1 Tax=Castellaniella sp. TaxID=1955812 RepID=UPI002AFEA6EC|nr:hypothetical protein [Castellaniella sp.]